MRLTADEIEAIKTAAVEIFGPGAVVRLFGSRVDDAKRGGDIDLLIEVDSGQERPCLADQFRARLFGLIEERKVDVLLLARGRAPRPIEQIALRDGVRL